MVYNSEEFDKHLVQLIKRPDKNEGKHPLYQQCCDHAEEMSWHLYGITPNKLLDRARPREAPEIATYRKENYEPTTKSAADKAINIVSKIFNPNLYSIRIKDKSTSGEDLWKYSMEEYPVYNSLVNFTKDVVLRKMLADPNGVLAIRPRYFPQTDAEQLQPDIKIFGSPNIWNYDFDHYLIFIEMKPEDAIKWYYFEYYDRTQYVTFRAYLTPNEKLVIDELGAYAWNFTEIPVWKLGGLVESQDNGEVMYKSFFASAAPFWNLAIVHESDVLGAYINHMHPLRWEISEECNYKREVDGITIGCRGGYLKNPKTGVDETCSKCGGSGTLSYGPYGVLKIPKSKLDPELGITDPIKYVSIETEATKMLEERAARMEQKGMWAINMDVEDEVGEVQSGVAKAIDRSAQYDTLFNISTVVFDIHLANFFYFFNLLMNGVKDSSQNKETDKNLPEINKPTQFDVAGTTELINNFKSAKEGGLDRNFINIKEQEILTRDYSTNPDLKLLSQKILDLDPLPGMTPDEISLGSMKGWISATDAAIHFNIKSFIEQAIDESSDFLNKRKKEQKEILKKLGDQFVKDNKPKLETSMLNPEGNAFGKKPLQTEKVA